MSHRPPKNDVERLENILEGLYDDDDMTDEEIDAAAEASGIDFDAWAAELKAKTQAARAAPHALEPAARRDAHPAGKVEGSAPAPAPAAVAGAEAKKGASKRTAPWTMGALLLAAALTGGICAIALVLRDRGPSNGGAPHLKEDALPGGPSEPEQVRDAGAAGSSTAEPRKAPRRHTPGK
jgi:hypothetical protein